MAKRDTSQLKWKKKKWYEIQAPALFNSVSLGETVTDDPEKVVGKVIQANMMNVVRNPRMQSVTMRFKITELKEGKGSTTPISYTMAPSALKRLVRSRRDRIDDSFVVKTKDDKHVRIKPLLITQANGTAAQRTAVRLAVRQMLANYGAQNTFETLVTQVVEQKLQREIKKESAKVLPIRSVDIRAFHLTEGRKITNFVEATPVEEETKAEE